MSFLQLCQNYRDKRTFAESPDADIKIHSMDQLSKSIAKYGF